MASLPSLLPIPSIPFYLGTVCSEMRDALCCLGVRSMSVFFFIVIIAAYSLVSFVPSPNLRFQYVYRTFCYNFYLGQRFDRGGSGILKGNRTNFTYAFAMSL